MSAYAGAHQAVFDLLRADAPLRALLAEDPLAGSPSLAAIYDHVPQPATPERAADFPYVVLGDSTGAGGDTDEIQGQELTLTLHVWDRRRGRLRVRQILDALHNVLHDVTLTVSGHVAVYCFWEFSESVPEESPNLQHAVTRFRIFIQET